MLRQDLINLLNSGDAWALVGSGASVDAGGPTWSGLLDAVVDELPDELRPALLDDGVFQVAVARHQYARALTRVQAISSRDHLESVIGDRLGSLNKGGPLGRFLADLPFEGYVTTNYDPVLERALEQNGQLGWISIGNLPKEIPKIASGSRIVWHVHGAVGLDDSESRLILTEEDYDDLYMEDTPLVQQMRALLSQRRIVCIGFSFEDPEFLRILKRVGRLTTPARPIYAFLSSEDDRSLDESRRDLLERYNIDVIYYRVREDSHEELLDLLRTYGAFVVRRSLQFGKAPRAVPSYAAETTALLIYDDLVLKGTASLEATVYDSLLRSRILGSLQARGPTASSKLTDELDARFGLVGQRNREQAAEDVRRVIDALVQEGLVAIAEQTVALTDSGSVELGAKAAIAERLERAFGAALSSRSRALGLNDAAAKRVSTAAEAFLKDCISRRALGVALVFGAWSAEVRQYQVVALMQSLPEFMEELSSNEEATALSALVAQVIAVPDDVELQYLGMTLQAEFAIHLLGYHEDALRERTRELLETCFLIDSNTLIPFLARSSWGHDAARMLIRKLGEVGCPVATTGLLAEEVAEHARWSMRRVDAGGALTTETLEAASGRAGAASNAFLDGFLEEVSQGTMIPNLLDYLSDVLGTARSKGPTYRDVCERLNELDVNCRRFDEWDGFDQLLYAESEELQERIAARRRERETYTHERQVRAEAEALLTIRSLRNGEFRVNESECSMAYFVSNTRILDELEDGSRLPITMQPESLLHWLGTVAPVGEEELAIFTSSLFGELFQRELTIVDEKRLSMIFGPLVSASQDDLEEQRVAHRGLLANLYGEDNLAAFSDVKPLDAPIIIQSVYRQRAEAAELETQRERDRRKQAEDRSSLSEDELKELERFRQRHEERVRKSRKGKRRARSRPKRRRRRR